MSSRPIARDWFEVAFSTRDFDGAGGAVPPTQLRGTDWTVALPDFLPTALVVDGRVAAIAHDLPDARMVTVVHLAAKRAIAHLTLDGATELGIRLADFALTVCDDRGRAAVLDLRTGALRRDLRVT